MPSDTIETSPSLFDVFETTPAVLPVGAVKIAAPTGRKLIASRNELPARRQRGSEGRPADQASAAVEIPPAPARPEQLFLSVKDVARRYGVSVPTIWRAALSGKLPRPKKLFNNTTRWARADLEAHEQKLEGQP